MPFLELQPFVRHAMTLQFLDDLAHTNVINPTDALLGGK
jgi:hypothetical protein